jgi:hypothetical protein
MKFCPNVNSKEYKDLAAIQGDAVAHYLWDTYKGEVPQPFYETKLGSPTQSKNIKPGVEELFESNPELASVGTLEQYSQYLDTIFPDSKVKDIVYRGGSLGVNQPENIEAFTTSKVYAEYRAQENNTQVYPAILNIKDSKLVNKKETRTLSLDRDELQYKDYGFTDNKDQTKQLGNFYTVKENNRYILGSKQDIAGFKEFTQKNIAFSQKPAGFKATGTVNEQRARKWLEQRFPGMSVEFYETAKNIGDDVVHGYVENASMFLWNQAEVGTEYHEAYHIAFRTMLSESQRESLYQEAAAEFGEPTKEEISKLAKQFNISNEEARKLALEERMAEQFREYVLTEQASQDNLPGRIKSWFKNLWNWIKAMFSDGVSLRQVYSLVESNNMNKSLLSRKVFRNSEKFKGYNTAFMQMPGMGDTLAAHTLDTIKLHFLESKKNYGKNFNTDLVVGTGTNKGSIANNFVKQLYVTADTGENVEVGVAIEILEAENNFIKAKENPNTTPEELQKAKTLLSAVLTKNNAKLALGNNRVVREAFKHIYNNWFSIVDAKTGNIIQPGWRDMLGIALEDLGLRLKGKDSDNNNVELVNEDLSDEEKEALENELEVLDGHVEKIYGKNSLQDSPSKRLTGKVKELLGRIPRTEPNLLGFRTYYSREEVYGELLQIFNNKLSYSEMVQALEAHVPYKPHLQPVLKFVNNLNAREQAMLFNAFALTTTQFILMRKRVSGKNVIVDVFNPNRKSVAEALVDRWRKIAVSNDVNDPKAIFIEREVKDTDGNTIKTIISSEAKVKEIQALVKKLEKRLLNERDLRKLSSAIRPAGEISDIAEILGDLAFALNLTPSLSSNALAARAAMQALINTGAKVTQDNKTTSYSDLSLAKFLGNQLRFFATKTATFESEGKAGTSDYSAVGNIVSYNIKSDFITAHKAAAYQLASLYEPMLSVAGESFVSTDGTQRYPTNIQSHMHEIVTNLRNYGKNEYANRVMQNYLQDPFIGALGVDKYKSILFRSFTEIPGFLESFTVEDFTGFKEDDFYDDATLYEDMTKVDSVIIRLNAYLNGGNSKLTKIALPIQADRDKYDFLTVPNILQTKGLNFATANELIKAQIVQDLLRVADAKKVVDDYLTTGNTENLITDYHDAKGEFKDLVTGEYLGRAFNSEFFQFTAKDKNGKQIVTDEALKFDKLSDENIQKLSDVIEDFVLGKLDSNVQTQIEARLSNMASGIMEYFDSQTAKVKDAITSRMDEVGFNTSDKGVVNDIIKGFVITETLMRNEIVKVFRGNRANAKSLTDFYKRMGHLTTPGNKYALMGELRDKNYGMMDTFNEATIADLKLNATPEQVARANQAAENLAAPLIKRAEAEQNPLVRAKLLAQAEKIKKTFSPNEFESTDAQGYISMEMYRGLMMGEGKWDKEIDEPAYKAYKQTGIFAYQEGAVPKGFKAGDRIPILPIKTYYEGLTLVGNTLAVDSQKNSYKVLLREETKDYPILEDLRSRMEAVGSYTGQDPIHVVNFVSGKKLLKRQIYKITGNNGEFTGLTSYKIDSRGLRRPQTIPDAKENPLITINRQIKKNMISNVKNGTQYYYDMGLDSETSVTGKELKEIYHSVIEEKIDRDIAEAKRELGLDKLEAATTAQEISDARLEILKKIRKLIQSDSLGSDMHSNFLAALNIEYGPDGMPRFTIPLDFPVYGAKYESVLMSIIQNRVFKQSMSGFEAVQVAELGGHAVDNELKFYEIEESNGRQRLIHAEIMIREDVARKFGIEPGQSLDSVPEELRRVIGYRIPNQDKASVVMAKIVRFLPANFPKSVVVPGQLIKLMGSDHDVDKLNLLFPEVEKDETSEFGIKKVRPDYSKLIGSKNIKESLKDKKVFTKKALNNIIWDTFEAVGLNEAHFFETLSPLDDETLKSEVNRVLEQKPELKASQDWNDMFTEADMMIRNQAGNALRGLYANLIAMRNVLSNGVVTLNKDFAPQIISGGTVTIYRNFAAINDDGTPTDKTGSLYLSAAVDAAKEDIEYTLNDNVITAPARMLLLSYMGEYEGKTATNLLNQPIVRKFVETLQDKYNGDTRNFKKAFKETISWANSQKTAISKADPNMVASQNTTTVLAKRNMDVSKGLVLDGKKSIPMLAEELENLSSDNRNMVEQQIMLNNFWVFYKAGQKLKKLGKRVTPDSMDGMNNVSNILSFKDRANEFELGLNDDPEEDTVVMFFGPNGDTNVADQFIGEDSIYGLERGYEKLSTTALEIASVLFPTKLSPAFLGAKEQIKTLAGTPELTSEMHRIIDNNLYLMLLMQPDSPIYDYFTGQDKVIAGMLSNPNNNLYTNLEAFKKKFPLLENNKFIMALEKDYEPEVGYYGVKFDNSFSFSKQEKEAFTTAIKTLLYNPQVYLNRPVTDKAVGPDGKFLIPEVQGEANDIKKLGFQIVFNSLLTSGLRKTASSYTELIPIEFFTEPMTHTYDQKKMQTSIKDFLYNVRGRLDATLFTEENLMNYVQMFGPQKAGGRPIFKRVNVDLNVSITPGKSLSLNSSEKVVVVSQKISETSKQRRLMMALNTGQTVTTTKGASSLFVILPSFLSNKTIYQLPVLDENYQNVLTQTTLELTADAKDPRLFGDTRVIQTCG